MKNISFFRDYQVKLVVFVIAVFIWFYVITENEYDYTIEVPVAVANLPENKVVLNKLPDHVKVKVRGTGKSLIALSLGGGAKVQLDLSDVRKERLFKLKPEYVFLTRRFADIQIEEIIMPDTIRVRLDAFKAKRVPVAAAVEPHVAPGFTIVGPITIVPDSVTIAGAASVVSKIDKVPTIAAKFTDLKYDFDKTIPLDLPDNVECTQQNVRVSMNIQELLELTLSGVRVSVKHVPRHISVYAVPSTLSLVLEGGGLVLSKVTRDDIHAYIDYNVAKRNPGKEHPPVIEVPRGVRYRDVKPKRFKLVFENASR